MNYSKNYDRLIKIHGSRDKPSGVYAECHHIIPRCLGGSDDKDNLVWLSPKAHYIAHLLLCGIYDWKHHGLNYALFMMGSLKKYGKKQGSRMYSKARHKVSAHLKIRMRGSKNPKSVVDEKKVYTILVLKHIHGYSLKDIMEVYPNLNKCTIREVIFPSQRNWQHLKRLFV